MLLTLALLALTQLPEGIPGREPSYERPAGSTSPKYIEFLEQNSHILYPLIAVAVLGILVIGILQAWRAQDLDGLAKAEFKREVILELRRNMGGISGEALARAVGLEPFKMAKLLEEMQTDGVLTSFTSSARLTVWSLKGVGPGRR